MRYLREAAAPFCRLDPGAELNVAGRRLDLDRDREAAGAPVSRAIGKFGAAQAPAGRQQRQGFERIGLPRAIVAGQHDSLPCDGEVELGVGAKIGERESRDGPPRGCVAQLAAQVSGGYLRDLLRDIGVLHAAMVFTTGATELRIAGLALKPEMHLA